MLTCSSFFFYCCHIYWQQVLTCSDSFTCSRGLPSTNFTLCWQLYLQQRFTFNQFYLVWTALPAADVDLQLVYFCIDTFTCSRGLLSTSFTLCWQLYLQQRLTYNQFYLVLTALPAAQVYLQPVLPCVDSFICSTGLPTTSFTLCWQLYLQQRFTWQGMVLLKPFLQTVFLLMAVYTCLTRISDYKHHWSDVLAGGLLGALVAVLVVRNVTIRTSCCPF